MSFGRLGLLGAGFSRLGARKTAAGGGGGVSPVVATFVDVDSSSTDLTVYDFIGVSLGDAEKLVVAIVGRSGGTPTISSVTVHTPDLATDPTGTALSSIAFIQAFGNVAAIFAVNRPSGQATGDIRVTFSTGLVRCGIVTYKMTTYAGTPVIGTSSAAPPTATLDVPANSAVIGVAFNGQMTTCTPTNLSEDHDGQVGGESAAFSAASSNSASGSTVFTLTFAAQTSPVGAFAAFPPS